MKTITSNRPNRAQWRRRALSLKTRFASLARRMENRRDYMHLWNWADAQDDADTYFAILDRQLRDRGLAALMASN